MNHTNLVHWFQIFVRQQELSTLLTDIYFASWLILVPITTQKYLNKNFTWLWTTIKFWLQLKNNDSRMKSQQYRLKCYGGTVNCDFIKILRSTDRQSLHCSSFYIVIYSFAERFPMTHYSDWLWSKRNHMMLLWQPESG